jgi:hypothetical protein
MSDSELVGLAFDILEDADVIEVFSDSVFLKVDRELWDQFINNGGLK